MQVLCDVNLTVGTIQKSEEVEQDPNLYGSKVSYSVVNSSFKMTSLTYLMDMRYSYSVTLLLFFLSQWIILVVLVVL